MHFTRSEHNHMQEFSITLHRETIYSEKINPVYKCLKIIRTAIYCLNKGLLLRNAIGNEENENSISFQIELQRIPEAEIIVAEDCMFFKMHKQAYSLQHKPMKNHLSLFTFQISVIPSDREFQNLIMHL